MVQALRQPPRDILLREILSLSRAAREPGAGGHPLRQISGRIHPVEPSRVVLAMPMRILHGELRLPHPPDSRKPHHSDRPSAAKHLVKPLEVLPAAHESRVLGEGDGEPYQRPHSLRDGAQCRGRRFVEKITQRNDDLPPLAGGLYVLARGMLPVDLASGRIAHQHQHGQGVVRPVLAVPVIDRKAVALPRLPLEVALSRLDLEGQDLPGRLATIHDLDIGVDAHVPPHQRTEYPSEPAREDVVHQANTLVLDRVVGPLSPGARDPGHWRFTGGIPPRHSTGRPAAGQLSGRGPRSCPKRSAGCGAATEIFRFAQDDRQGAGVGLGSGQGNCRRGWSSSSTFAGGGAAEVIVQSSITVMQDTRGGRTGEWAQAWRAAPRARSL